MLQLFARSMVLICLVSISKSALAQFDIDSDSGIIYQHMPMDKGDSAPFEGVLMKGERYATLKLAEFKLSIKEQELAKLKSDYVNLEAAAVDCRTQLVNRCPPTQCSPSPSWYADSRVWFGVLGGVLITTIVAVVAAAGS